MNNNHQQQNFFMGALLGGLAGATAMLLFTPVSGERLRNKLMNGIGLEATTRHKRPSRSAASKTARIHVSKTSSRSASKGHRKATAKRASHKVVRIKRAKSASHAASKETHHA